MAILNDQSVQTIRSLATKVPQREIAARYGVSQACISDIQRRKTWAHVT